jgi:hypothetical protein
VDPLTLGLVAVVAYFAIKSRKVDDTPRPFPPLGGAEELPAVPGVTLPPAVPAVTLIPAVPSTPTTNKPTTSKPANPVPNWGAIAGVPGAAAAGYDVAKWPDFRSVRQAGYRLGYKTATDRTGAGALTKKPGEPWVRRFQNDYNAEQAAPGRLDVDGVPGAQTLNALQWAGATVARGTWWALRHTGTP